MIGGNKNYIIAFQNDLADVCQYIADPKVRIKAVTFFSNYPAT